MADHDDVEQGFLERLRTRPDDDDNRLVYADWLEERGRVAETEFLRLQASLKKMSTEDPTFQSSGIHLRELALRVDQTWRMLVARAPIEHCEARFDFACPKQWEALAPTKHGDDVRFCNACEKDVYYSKTLPEAYEHARQGRCVVVDLVQLRKPGDFPSMPLLPQSPGPPMMAGAIAAPPDGWPNAEPPREPFFARVKKIFDR